MEDENSSAIDQTLEDVPKEDKNTEIQPEQNNEIISEEKINLDQEAVQKVTTDLYNMLKKATSNQDPNAILDIDVAYFCENALQT